MHELLFRRKPSIEGVLSLAVEMKLDASRFRECIGNSASMVSQIEKERQYARDFQLTGTPAFVVGELDGSNQFRPKKIIRGAQPFPVFKTVLSDVLGKQSVEVR
jgi:predicted DsbA family dithiol-disulfide isomerase